MKKPTRRHAGHRRNAYVVALEEVLTVLIGQSDVAATLAVLEARFRLLAQDPPRGVRGADITRVAKPLLALFRGGAAVGKPRLVRSRRTLQEARDLEHEAFRELYGSAR